MKEYLTFLLENYYIIVAGTHIILIQEKVRVDDDSDLIGKSYNLSTNPEYAQWLLEHNLEYMFQQDKWYDDKYLYELKAAIKIMTT